MSHVAAVSGVLPPHRYRQEELTELFADLVGADAGLDGELLRRLHASAGVDYRSLALPAAAYAALRDFSAANDTFIALAVDLGVRAINDALAQAGLDASDVDLILSATITGLAVPSLDARMAARLGLRDDVKRLPVVGLGCVAGAAGIARVHDYLLGHPGEVGVVVAVELCSLTVQRDDASVANLVASGLFGDGAAAVVLLGADRATSSGAGPAGGAPRVLATRSRLYPDTERAMGWDVGSTGLRIVLGVEVPELVRANVGGDVDGFLADHGLTRADIRWWVAHPGGPKVLEALAEALGLERDDLGVTWASLASIGNLSSASVLHVLADTLRDRPPTPGSYGVLLAMGPGFCLELVLLQAGVTR